MKISDQTAWNWGVTKLFSYIQAQKTIKRQNKYTSRRKQGGNEDGSSRRKDRVKSKPKKDKKIKHR